ncbi:MAG: universal stress protein [Polyangiaceae bacterium]|nr:universal stress protein [Polyangiaceae bacterium]
MSTLEGQNACPVLVATDFSPPADEAIRQADAWAQRRGAELSVMHVAFQFLPMHPLFPQRNQGDLTDLVTLESRLAEQLSDRVMELTERPDGGFAVDVDFGEPYAVIVKRAEEVGAGLLAVGSTGATELERVPLGSVAEKVVRYAHCSVLVARPLPGSGVVLVASDLSDPAQPAVEAAAREAQARDARLVVFHGIEAWSTVPDGLGVMGPLPAEPDERTLEQFSQAVTQILKGQLGRFGADGDVRVAVGGDPASEIARVAREENADLVVLANRGRTGLARLALGSVAETVVRRAHCSVLAVRAP